MTEVCKDGDFDIVLVAVPTDTPVPEGAEEEDELMLENNYRE